MNLSQSYIHLNLQALSHKKLMCWHSRRSQTWGITDCHLHWFLEDLSLVSITKLDPALLSFRITYTIPIPQMSARKLSWTISVWRQQLFCSGALQQGIHISSLEELFFLYLPKENNAWLLPHTSCHPHNQTLWLNCLAQTEFKHWTLNSICVTTVWRYQHRWGEPSTAPKVLRLEHPISHLARAE